MSDKSYVKSTETDEKINTQSIKININKESTEQQKNSNITLGKVGYLISENIKNNKPELYAELKSKGILLSTIYEIQESVKAQMKLIESQLRKENPPPKTENTMELLKYNEWLKDRVWELVQDQIFFC